MFALANITFATASCMFALANITVAMASCMFALANITVATTSCMFALANITVTTGNCMFALANITVTTGSCMFAFANVTFRRGSSSCPGKYEFNHMNFEYGHHECESWCGTKQVSGGRGAICGGISERGNSLEPYRAGRNAKNNAAAMVAAAASLTTLQDYQFNNF